MSYSPRQQRAINWYAKRENLRLCLSAWPVITFQKKSDASKVDVHIQNLTDWYSADLKDQARERAKERRQQKSRKAAS